MRISQWKKTGALTLAALLGLTPALQAAAQSRWTSPLEQPDEQGRFILRLPGPEQAPERPLIEPDPPLPPRRPFTLEDLRIQSDADLDRDTLAEPLSEWLDQPIGFGELQQLAAELLVHLRANGHPLAQIDLLPGSTVGNPFDGLDLYGLTKPPEETVPTLAVTKYDVQGVTVMAPEAVAGVLAPWTDRNLTLGEIEEATGAITQALKDQGYLLAEAYLPPQDINDGTVIVQVDEGRLDGEAGVGGITVAGDQQRVSDAVIQAFLARGVLPGEPVNTDPLERAITLADRLPGVESIEVDLLPGTEPATTQLEARVTDAPLATARLSADNFGSRFTGRARASAAVSIDSPTGRGERYTANVTRTSESWLANLAVNAPLNTNGWRAGARLGILDSGIDLEAVEEDENVSSDLRSDSESLTLFTSYPLVAGPRNNVEVTLSAETSRFERRFSDFESPLDRDARTDSGTLTLSGDWLDDLQGQGRWSLAARRGELDLKDGSIDQEVDALTAETEGDFTTVDASIGRLQFLDWMPGSGWSTWGSLRGQWADRNLDPAEKFQLGGPYGVRAYPVGEASGDQGWLATAELRKEFFEVSGGTLHGFVFYDIGGVRQYEVPSEQLLGDQPNSYKLRGYGFGFNLNISDRFDLRLIGARKDGSNPNPNADGTDADGYDNDARGWIIGTAKF